MDKFSYRLGNLEARLTGPHLIGEPSYKDGYTVDICQWSDTLSSEGKPYHWSLAYFVRTKDDSWDLHFVANRPLASTVSWEVFGKLVIEGYGILCSLVDTEPHFEDEPY